MVISIIGGIALKKIAIIGAGGFGKEVAFLLERMGNWDIIGFFDDCNTSEEVYGYKILGNTDNLIDYESKISVVCAIGNSLVRHKIIEKIINNKNLYFPTVIDPSVIYSESVKLGKGNIICMGSILTVDITIGDFNVINFSSTIGHDVKIGSFNTFFPAVNISGFIETENFIEVGVGTQIIQNLKVGENAIIGAGSVVIRDVPANTLSVGVPSKIIKQRSEVIR